MGYKHYLKNNLKTLVDDILKYSSLAIVEKVIIKDWSFSHRYMTSN